MRWSAVAVAVCAFAVNKADAQSVGGEAARVPIISVSLATGLLMLHAVDDGPSASTWDIELAREHRASFDFTVARNTTLGVTFGFSSLSILYAPRTAAPSVAQACLPSCTAIADFRSLTASLRGVSGPGFHHVLELNVGITEYSGFREERTGARLAPFDGDKDWAMTTGYGVGWSAGRRLQISIVADVGFAIHTRSERDSNRAHMNWLTGARFVVRSGVFP